MEPVEAIPRPVEIAEERVQNAAATVPVGETEHVEDIFRPAEVADEPIILRTATFSSTSLPMGLEDEDVASVASSAARISAVQKVTEPETLLAVTGKERWSRADIIRHLESSATPGRDVVFLMNQAINTVKNDVDRNKNDTIGSVQSWRNNFSKLPTALALMENQENAKDVVEALWPWAQRCIADNDLSAIQKRGIVEEIGMAFADIQEMSSDAQSAYKTNAVRLQARFLHSFPADIYKMLCTFPEDIAPSAGLLSRSASEIGSQVAAQRDALTTEEWPGLEQRYRTIRQYDVLESFLGQRTKPEDGWYEKPTYAGVLRWVCTEPTDATSQEVGRRLVDQYIAACMEDETGVAMGLNAQPDTLNFSGMGIRTFPDISKYPMVPAYSRLDVSGKRPWEFRKPPDITTLDFSDNHFTDETLPDFSTFEKLTTLDVSQNRLKTVPDWMQQLPKSCVVHVGGNEGLNEAAIQKANQYSKGTKTTGPTFTLLSQDQYRAEQQRKTETSRSLFNRR
jgi:hypothetical protein